MAQNEKWDLGLASPVVQQMRARFFAAPCCPVAVSNLTSCLASGTPIETLRVPVSILPQVVILAHIGYHEHDQMIVDDYSELLTRMAETFRAYTHADFYADGDQLQYVSHIAIYGAHGYNVLEGMKKFDYVRALYQVLVET